jgi:hypothetical protein
MSEPLGLSYLLPLRWTEERNLAELSAYLRFLAARCEVVVVDASPPELARRHRTAWGSTVRALPPSPDLGALNGKARGVLTGVPLCAHERVVIADDDVRYEDAALRRMSRLLDDADLVRPQNYFDPRPWHARWDTARSLVNRALGADYPGTLGVRRSRFLEMGGYDGDVLFENLELIRTVRAAGGRVASVKDSHHPVVGDITLTYNRMELPAETGLTIMTYVAEPGSKSAQALGLLGSWTATLEQAESAGERSVRTIGLAERLVDEHGEVFDEAR